MPDSLPSDRFYRAWFAPELKLLGHVCPPFCLGHRLTLAAMGSPFVTGERDKTPGDVLLFLAVCSRAAWPFHRFDPGTPDPALLAKLGDEGALTEALVAIYEWIAECGASPRPGEELWESEGEECGRPVTAPIVLAIAAKLMRNRIPRREAFTMPEGVARWWCATFDELDGGAAFVTDEDAEMMDDILRAGGGRN